MIPKIIWQTHEMPYEQLPNFQKNITNTWKNLNPGWEYRYVGAEERLETVKKYNEIMFNYYINADKIHQADLWRYITIYRNGGFYADMDSVCTQSIDDSLLKNYKGEDLVCSPVGYQHYGVNNSNFGAVKNSQIIKLLLDILLGEYQKIKTEDVLFLDFGWPENTLFSNTALDFIDFIFFNSDYFIHSKDFKEKFREDIDVVFNGEKTSYGLLCKTMNWPIDYI